MTDALSSKELLYGAKTKVEEIKATLLDMRAFGLRGDLPSDEALYLIGEIESARRTAEHWKAEHLAGNAEIERLQRQQTNLIAALGAKQAKLDEIMLEMYPGELSPQRRAELRKPAHEREMPHCSTCSCPPYQAPEPPAEPTPRYQCMVKGCPGNHPSKWGVCDTRPYEAIAVWLDADGNFQWDFETNEDHPIDATIALARRTNWVMTDKGWRLAQPPGDVQA